MIHKIRVLVIAFAIVVAVSGCRSVKHVTTDQHRHDSVVYLERTVVKDSLIRVPVPADSALIEAIVECDSLNQAHIAYIVSLTDGARARVSMKLENNVLSLQCKCDSFAVYSILHTRYQELAESASSYKLETKQVARSDIPTHFYLLLFTFTTISIFLSIKSFLNHDKRSQ